MNINIFKLKIHSILKLQKKMIINLHFSGIEKNIYTFIFGYMYYKISLKEKLDYNVLTDIERNEMILRKCNLLHR